MGGYYQRIKSSPKPMEKVELISKGCFGGEVAYKKTAPSAHYPDLSSHDLIGSQNLYFYLVELTLCIEHHSTPCTLDPAGKVSNQEDDIRLQIPCQMSPLVMYHGSELQLLVPYWATIRQYHPETLPLQAVIFLITFLIAPPLLTKALSWTNSFCCWRTNHTHPDILIKRLLVPTQGAYLRTFVAFSAGSASDWLIPWGIVAFFV